MKTVIKTIDKFIDNIRKKQIKVLNSSGNLGAYREMEAEIDRFKKLRKICEEELSKSDGPN